MNLHVPSLVFIHTLVLTTLAVCIGLTARREKNDGLFFWGLALAANCGVYVLHMLHEHVSYWLAVILTNVLLTSTFSLMLEGFHQMQQNRPQRFWVWLPVIVVSVMSPLLIQHTETSIALLTTLLCFQLAQFIWTMSQQWSNIPGRGKFFLFVGVTLSMIGLLIKANTSMDGSMGASLENKSISLQTLVFSISSIAMVISSFGIAVMLKDRVNASSHALIFTDDLTGLHNRRYMQLALETKIVDAQRMQQPLSLLILDVDFFKRINDTYGHLCGDQVLRDLASCLRSNLRAGDIAGRWGGEEFVLILPHTDAVGAASLAERLRTSVQKAHFVMNDKTIYQVTVSIGLHTLNRATAVNVQDILTTADKALYIAKNSGRNCVAVL